MPRFWRVLDSIRLSAWLLFAVSLVTSGGGETSEHKRRYLIAAALFCAVAIAVDLRALVLGEGQSFAQIFVRIGFGVLGLLTVENLWRNTDPWRRWHVWPVCLAIGLLYAYEFFLFSDAFITRGRVDPGLALGRAIAARFCGAAFGIGHGAQQRVAGRHPCFPASGVSYRYTFC